MAASTHNVKRMHYAVQCSRIQCSAIQFSAVQCIILQYNAVHFNSVQHSSEYYGTGQFPTVHYSSKHYLSWRTHDMNVIYIAKSQFSIGIKGDIFCALPGCHIQRGCYLSSCVQYKEFRWATLRLAAIEEDWVIHWLIMNITVIKFQFSSLSFRDQTHFITKSHI